MAAAQAQAQAQAKSPWLHAWKDPVADLKAFSSCVRLADLNGDGDYKLIVADAKRRLKVYRNTSLVSENVLLDTPVAMCVTYSDTARPRVPSVSVAAGPHVFIYRRLRPYYKFTLPPMAMAPSEAEVWAKLNDNRMDVAQATDLLVSARDSGAALSTRSVDLINTEAPEERQALVDSLRDVPLAQQTVITCMEVLKKNMDEEDALSQLVIGTENGEVLILDVSGVTILQKFKLQAAPVFLAVTGLFDVEYRIVAATRSGTVYTIKNGEVTGTVIELEGQPCGLCRIDKQIIIPCMGNVVHSYHIKGKKSFSLYMPAPVAGVEVLSLQRMRVVKALLVALHNGEVRLYNEKQLITTLHLEDPAVGMRFSAYGREEGALAMVGKAGTLCIKMLQRKANLDSMGAPPGPPPEQDIPLAIPKKTKLYVEQTQRERDQATEMHRIFQRDLCKLRLNTARAYVKVLTDGQGSQSYMSGASVRLTAQVQGLGPLFKIKLNLQNMGTGPVPDLELSFVANPALYRLKSRVMLVPLLLPAVNYHTECDIESIEESGMADVVRVYVCKQESKLPLLSAVVTMPLSEAPVPD
mmetsp:Transcript_17510/g.47251  ORF Transcript_17510/g.47251 Transcript_17510/m.47251 type:complete len:581 (+) Transcript_17510:24-1766(+)